MVVREFRVLEYHEDDIKRALGKSEDEEVDLNQWLPKRATSRSAGYDIRSTKDYSVAPGETVLVNTGLTVHMCNDEELQIRSRSGLALKNGIIVLNAPGTIDADYEGNHIGVIIYNTSDEVYKIKAGDRVAQGVFSKYLVVDGDSVSGRCGDFDSERLGGFGSTGVE